MVALSKYFLVFFLLASIATATDQLDPDILFQYPWTPIHEKTIQKALDAPSTLDLEGVWDFWPDLSDTQAIEVTLKPVYA